RAPAAVAETFAEILAAALEQPQQPIARARGLSLASEQRVIRLAGHAVSYGPFVPVPAQVEWQADRHPNRPRSCSPAPPSATPASTSSPTAWPARWPAAASGRASSSPC